MAHQMYFKILINPPEENDDQVGSSDESVSSKETVTRAMGVSLDLEDGFSASTSSEFEFFASDEGGLKCGCSRSRLKLK